MDALSSDRTEDVSNDKPHSDIDKVQRLVWALLDDQIDKEQIEELNQVLAEDAGARRAYIDCVQMHVELQHFFSPKQESNSNNPLSDASMLGMLQEKQPFGFAPPQTDALGS